MFKKRDIIIYFFIFLSAFSAFFAVIKKESGKSAVVSQNNKIVIKADLSEDREIKLEHNTIVIKNDEVFMLCADCPDKVCVKKGKISKKGESIICLPNRVAVEIE